MNMQNFGTLEIQKGKFTFMNPTIGIDTHSLALVTRNFLGLLNRFKIREKLGDSHEAKVV